MDQCITMLLGKKIKETETSRSSDGSCKRTAQGISSITVRKLDNFGHIVIPKSSNI